MLETMRSCPTEVFERRGTLAEVMRPVEILLIEDNAVDARLTEVALRDGKLRNRLHVVRDGEGALDFLFRRAGYADAPRPDMILLDLNLPRVDGREVLAEIKADPSLKTIPVIVLTTSKTPDDILQTYRLHVNCFVTKPLEMDLFLEAVRNITQFWTSVVALPADLP